MKSLGIPNKMLSTSDRESMQMEYLFVDFENIAVSALTNLSPRQTVLLFAGEKQTRIKTDLVEQLLSLGSQAKLIRIQGNGKNALDFHIAFYLGKLAETDEGASFKILSKDTGFDPLVRHLRGANIDCARIENLEAEASPKTKSQAGLSAFAAHLKGLAEKARPKKAIKLKAYLKNWAKADDSSVERIFRGLIAGKHIEVEGQKITYLGVPAKKG